MNAPQIGSKAYAMAMFGIVSVLAGLLLAGFAVPAAALVGSGAKAAAGSLDNLPAELETPPNAAKTVIYLGNGQPLAELYDQNRVVVGLDQIAPVMRLAQLAIEDHRFYEHGAIDLKGTLRALARNSTGGATQGGSTLTQQYVKQVQIEAAAARGDQNGVLAAQAPTIERKIMEMRYAIAIESKFSKDEILNRYLNIAYYGDGAYGVEAAARHYYSTTASALTLGQAAMIAGIVQNPNLDPVNRPAQATERRNVVLNRMAEIGLAAQADVDAAKKEAFDKSKVQANNQGCAARGAVKYPFMCDFVYRTLLTNPALGQTVEERRNVVMRGGLNVYTQIDPGMMDVAQQELSKLVAAKDPVVSTMTMIQPGTGLILAMVQNRNVMGADAAAGETFYNYSVERALGGAEGYQAGSTFKPFTVAAALDRGIPPTLKFDALSPMDFKGKQFLTCDASGKDSRFKLYGDYRVENSTISGRDMDMYKATEMSVNTYFIQLEQVAGICQSARMADKLGVKLSNGKSMEKEYAEIASYTLGVAEVSPISMASAYATLAARGVRCDPIIIKNIKSRDGKDVATPNGNCVQAIPPQIADGVSSVLERVMTNGTGRDVRTGDGRPQAGKTGTIDSNAAVWFAGYTPNLAGVAMIAVDKNPAYKDYWAARNGSLKNITLSTGMYLSGSGSGDAGDIWRPTMAAAVKNFPAVGFTAPPPEVIKGKAPTPPSTRGMSYNTAKATLEGAGFAVVDRNVYSNSSRGAWVGVQCEGFVCYMNISMGPRPQAPQPQQPQQPQPQPQQPEQPQQPGVAAPGEQGPG